MNRSRLDKSVYEPRRHGTWPTAETPDELYRQATAPILPSTCTCHAHCTCDHEEPT